MSQIKRFLEQQEVYQLYKESRRRPAFSPITVYSVNDQWQVDLIDLSKYARWNAGYKYLLCAIDVFSRKSFVVAMKRKSDTTDAMKLILDVQKPILIQSDNGTEFLNNSFQSLLQAKGVRHVTVNVGDHNRQGLIERFNRIIENSISRYQESRKSNRYIDVLEDIVFNYNHTYHRSVAFSQSI
jgi:transposase InsO family protein